MEADKCRNVYMHACSMTTQNHVVLQIVHTTSCSLLVDPLQVVQHPVSQSVATGVNVSFRVEASGDRIKFQWQKDGSDLYDSNRCWGTNTETLHLKDVGKSDKGHYKCILRNDLESKLSRNAQLDVCKYNKHII